MTETLLIISIILSVLCLVLLAVLLLKKKREDGGAAAEQIRRLEEKTDAVGKIADYNARVLESLNRSTEARLTGIQNRLSDDIKYIVETNAQNLERIRRTVDDKLTNSIDGKLSDSFARISERLEKMYQSVGEMKGLSANVADIKRVFTNVKLRGTWGEAQLDAVLEQMLAPEQYRRSVKLNPLDNSLVDFAIVLPAKDGEMFLPVDSKFQIENYERLLAAQSDGVAAAMNAARKALETDLKNQAKSIKDKYISPPKTTDFAVMYLPSEGLYAEAMSMPGLSAKLRQDYQVVVGGPSVIAALLNSLQMGFRSLQLQKNSAEIRKAFDRFRKDFGKLNELISKAKERSEKVTKDLGEALDRNDKIKGTLGKYAIAAPEDEAAAAIDAPAEGDNES